MQISVLTLKTRKLNQGKASRLSRLAEQFTECARFCLAKAISLGTGNSSEHHHACYREARSRFHLASQSISLSRYKAIGVYRAYLSLKRRKGSCKLPSFRKTLPIGLISSQIRIYPEKSVARISMPEKHTFLWLPLIIPPHLRGRVGLKLHASELIKRGDDWFLLLKVESPDVPVVETNKPHFGLDLGISNLAVLSGPNYVEFFDGKPLHYLRCRLFRYRQAIHIKRKFGMLKRSKGRESNWATNANHQASRKIVDVVAQAGGVLHIECLKGITKRFRGTAKTKRMMNSWAFGQLIRFIKYKAAAAGVLVIEEDPRHTSQRCSRCGHTEKGNRLTQSRFKCVACGYELNADLNAARNLAAKGACSFSVGDTASPGYLDTESGEGDAVPPGSSPVTTTQQAPRRSPSRSRQGGCRSSISITKPSEVAS